MRPVDVFFILFGEFLDLAGNFLEVLFHFLNLGFHYVPVVLQELAALFQGFVPLHAEFHKVFYLLDGHAGIFQAADEAEPFKVAFRIPADSAAAPAHAGEESFMFVIAQHVGSQGRFFRNLLNRIRYWLFHAAPPPLCLRSGIWYHQGKNVAMTPVSAACPVSVRLEPYSWLSYRGTIAWNAIAFLFRMRLHLGLECGCI
jgi:hypothetical protein